MTTVPDLKSAPEHKPKATVVRIAAVQYLLRSIADWDGFENQVRFVMKTAAEYKPQFVLFPEIFTTQLLSFLDTTDLYAAVRGLNDFTERYVALFVELAQHRKVHIIGGSHPTITNGRMYNTAYLFTPEGKVFTQDKIHLTRWEKEKWKGDPGNMLRVFDTPHGRIAILICYDIEFPELARKVSEQGADIIFVPSCTDDKQGFCGCGIAATHEPSRTRFTSPSPARWATCRSKALANTLAKPPSSHRLTLRLHATALPPKVCPTWNRSSWQTSTWANW